MKKIISIILVLVMVCACLTACTGSKNENDVNSSSKNELQQDDTNNGRDKDSESSNDGIFDVLDVIHTESLDRVFGSAYINLPQVASMSKGMGNVAEQNDKTLILFSGEHGDDFSTEAHSGKYTLENVFSVFLEQPISILSHYRRVDNTDYAFEIETSELVEINGYKMCKHTGKHTYKAADRGDLSLKYVAYITNLKSNNAYVYWIVLDESEDQSQGAKIDEYATKIAKSLREEDS